MKYLIVLFSLMWLAPVQAQIDSTKSVMLQGEQKMIDMSLTRNEYIQFYDYQKTGHRSLQAAGGLLLAGVVVPFALILGTRGHPDASAVAGGISLGCLLGGSISLISAGTNLKRAREVQRRAVVRQWNNEEGL